MKDLNSVQKGKYNTYFETLDGRLSFPLNPEVGISMTTKVDIFKGVYVDSDDKEYKSSDLRMLSWYVHHGGIIVKKYGDESGGDKPENNIN